ncbi:MAG TPA: hypothetical protein V6D29_00830 [Leptolyngbyaceae cyanobacterium]
MKAFLIRLFILQKGAISLVSFCLLWLILTSLPPIMPGQAARNGGDDFPGQRRGGGTHWVEPLQKPA